MIHSCRSVSNTSMGGSQRTLQLPAGEGSKNCRWSCSACLSSAQASAHIWFFGSRIGANLTQLCYSDLSLHPIPPH